MQITAKTSVYCLIGHPVGHSLSPLVHNQAFKATGHQGVYVAFDTADHAGSAAAIRALGIKGASVTIPHKVNIMAHLDEIDGHARQIGAVNTILHSGGKLHGYNTDGYGGQKAIEEKTSIAKKKVLIIGAGGAARALGFSFKNRGADVCIANRTYEKARFLAQDLGAVSVSLDEISDRNFDILVNTTPVGMHPATDAVPVPESVLTPGMYVMDIIYNPVRTKLLQKAEAAGCHVIDGVGMFVFQGAAQFSLWTGIEAPVAQMRRVVYEYLNNLDK